MINNSLGYEAPDTKIVELHVSNVILNMSGTGNTIDNGTLDDWTANSL